MREKTNVKKDSSSLSRRKFFQVGGALAAGGSLILPGISCKGGGDEGKIKKYRTLGRTGFKVSEIAMGGTRNRDATVVRYAYDHGINYFDMGETYINGQAEQFIGENQQFMDRKKIFITTKIRLREDETKESMLERFRKCQERLNTDYIDAFYMHGVPTIDMLSNANFHAVTDQLKSEGRIKYIGLSCHGPGRTSNGNSMEEVCLAAAEDGRFDLMLLIYNFMNKEAGEKILAACKKNNIGTTAMKTAPGVLKAIAYDPENPTPAQTRSVDRMKERNMSDEQIMERMQRSYEQQKETAEKTKPFAEKYGIMTEDDLRVASVHWVMQNPDMHTTCVSFADFDLIDRVLPISGTKLSMTERNFIGDYRLAFNNNYCRHGCDICVAKCPKHLPVSTIMRYAYYFECQGREKDAMVKYHRLEGKDGSLCLKCDGQCAGACPHGVDIQANLVQAHGHLALV